MNSSKESIIIRIFLFSAVLLLTLSFLSSSAADTTLYIYEDTLSRNWQNWSWDCQVDFQNNDFSHNEKNSIKITYEKSWAGFYLHTKSLNVSKYDTLCFWIFGAENSDQKISFSINQFYDTYNFTLMDNTWQKIEVPLSEVGYPELINDLIWQSNSNGSQKPYFISSIYLTQLYPEQGTTADRGPNLVVDAAKIYHQISPNIYGMNFALENLADDLSLAINRRGGNATTRYNWKIDVHNTGSDWYFENIPGTAAQSESLPHGSASDLFIEQNRRTNTHSIITIPLLGWAAKPGATSHPFDAAFKVSKYGIQDSIDPWDTDCGNGLINGEIIRNNDPADTSIKIDPDFTAAWIRHMTQKYGTAQNGGVKFYSFDNEPMLWNSSHRDIHPKAVTYDEIISRTQKYGAAIKKADSGSKTLGPVAWGWCAYFYSAADGCSPGLDRKNHNDMDFIPWYLKKMAEYEFNNKVRILDYLDLHIYPQMEGIYSETAGERSTQQARLRSTRQLWDNTYTQEGWINDKIYLIPRMKQWIEAFYPKTKTAITEYNWGALGTINGALAQADILGIFGKEGIDLATLWGTLKFDDPGAYAFRMYLNYDGKKSTFGSTSIFSNSENQDQLSIYSALRNNKSVMTVMVINKAFKDLSTEIDIKNFSDIQNAEVFRYNDKNLLSIVRVKDQRIISKKIKTVIPENSITLFVLKKK